MRTQVVKACVAANLSVARFVTYAKRTRLNKKNYKDTQKINEHIIMWKKYNWI